MTSTSLISVGTEKKMEIERQGSMENERGVWLRQMEALQLERTKNLSSSRLIEGPASKYGNANTNPQTTAEISAFKQGPGLRALSDGAGTDRKSSDIHFDRIGNALAARRFTVQGEEAFDTTELRSDGSDVPLSVEISMADLRHAALASLLARNLAISLKTTESNSDSSSDEEGVKGADWNNVDGLAWQKRLMHISVDGTLVSVWIRDSDLNPHQTGRLRFRLMDAFMPAGLYLERMMVNGKLQYEAGRTQEATKKRVGDQPILDIANYYNRCDFTTKEKTYGN
jgi:hypothetical protein